MASIEGFYIADDKESLIFEYPTTSNSPDLKTILATARGIDTADVQNISIIEISNVHTVYRIKSNRLFLYALVQGAGKDVESLKLQTLSSESISDDQETQDEYEVHLDEKKQVLQNTLQSEFYPINPNTIFTFLNTINRVLVDYFGEPLSPIKIEANYDIMCNLMQELVEAGYPYITDANTLKELVPFSSSLGSKLLSTTNQLAKSYVNSTLSSSHTSLSSMNGDGSRVPWRKPNVKYTNNELFLDIREEINVVLAHPRHASKCKGKQKSFARLTPTLAVIKGSLDFTSHLSGTPDIQLLLNLNDHSLGVPSFHRCIRVDDWLNNEGHLSFIPPDGKTTIMDYTIDLDQHPASRIERSIGLVNIDYKDGLGLKKNEFEINLSINLYKNVSKISNLVVLIKTNEGDSLKTLRVSHGDLQTKSSGVFEWKFDQSTSLGINPVLRGVIEPEGSLSTQPNAEKGDTTVHVVFPMSVSLSYSNTGSIPSSIRVGSLKIVRGLSEVKPFKGVKYITKTGDFVIR